MRSAWERVREEPVLVMLEVVEVVLRAVMGLLGAWLAWDSLKGLFGGG